MTTNIYSIKIYPKNRDMSKRWFVRIRTRAASVTTRHTLWIPDAATPAERLALAEAAINEFKNPSPKKPSHAVIEQLFGLLETMRPRIRRKTHFSYRNTLVTFRDYCELHKVEKYSIELANMFLNAQLDNGKSPKTVNNYRTVLKMFFAILQKQNKRFVNIFIETEKLKGHAKLPVHYKTQQITQLKKYMSEHCPHLWFAVRFLFYCYIRPGELRQLKVHHIDFDEWTIRVPREISKNGKDQYVTIPDAFRRELSTLCLYQWDANFYLVGRDGLPSAEQVSDNFWSNAHRKMLRALNYSADYNLYTWKHTGAVQAVKANIPLKEIQLQLRHHSLDMTNIYLASFGVGDMVGMRERMPTI